MDPLFYSPNGSSWNLRDPDVVIDSSKVVTMPVRKYTYQNTKYAILACADMSLPSDIFYMLSVSRPNGADISSPQERDFKIVKKLMKYAPINVEQYEVAENKLVRKITNRKRLAFVESKNVQYESTESFKADTKDDQIMNEALKTTNDPQSVHLLAADTKDDQIKKEALEITNEPQPVQLFADDDSDGMCGIMGVYCRSGIHGDYRDICTEDERKIA